MDEDIGALGVQKPDHEPRATRVRAADAGDDRRAGEERARLPGARPRRELRGAQVPGLRQALGQVARRPARRRARRGGCGEAGPARFRAVEAFQARRAEMALALGRRAPGLAHRVLGHGLHAARRRTSTSTAAARTCSSRTTRTRSRSPKGANGGTFVNYWMHNGFVRWTRRRCPSRSATSSPSATSSRSTIPRWCASSSCARTTAARSTTPTCTSRTRKRR